MAYIIEDIYGREREVSRFEYRCHLFIYYAIIVVGIIAGYGILVK